MGHVQKNEVLAKFMKNGEWDFHHVEAVPHNPQVEKHDNDAGEMKGTYNKYIKYTSNDSFLSIMHQV